VSAPQGTTALPPAQLAKAALRRLAEARLEPTPENYARAYAEESGQPVSTLPPRALEQLDRIAARLCDDAPTRQAWVQALAAGRADELSRQGERLLDAAAASAQGWAQLIERLARGLERSTRLWTGARKKDSLQRVLEGSGRDAARLQQRLRQLLTQWEQDTDDDAPPVEGAAAATAAVAAADTAAPADARQAPVAAPTPPVEPWPPIAQALHGALHVALSPASDAPVRLADELAALAARVAAEGATPELVGAIQAACERAARWLGHRHELLAQLGRLCHELSGGLAEVAEDDSWVRGQCDQLREHLGLPPTLRGVRAATDLLALARDRQRGLRVERAHARDALKSLIHRMLAELGTLGETTGRFSDSIGRYAQAVEQADSLESLALAVREMVEESSAVHALVSQTQARLRDGHERASELQARVMALEDELRRLSDEVATDALTQVANRRGLESRFQIEASRADRSGATLAIGLLDIDNFKRLNDTLGHAAGDQALKALAAHVRDALRPQDALARFGGEEFVVLMPDTGVEDARQALTRLQRGLTASLFMHDDKEVLVTFSAGVTAWRVGEPLQTALERADEALYEAKRTGKNRTCLA
jgi:diguanylate cyclase